jgi:nucleoside-diphosphate-sugar epimerase
MRVLVAGAGGAIGIPLTRDLVRAGHDVIGLTAHPSEAVTALGATSVVADALDRDALMRAVDGIRADAVVHELTALKRPPLHHRDMTMTDRLRSDGTANLLAVAESIGARRFVTQSMILGYGYYDHGDTFVTEDAPFGRLVGDRSDPHVAAMRAAEEQTFTAPEGIALRYGGFYGGDVANMRALLQHRRVPIVSGGVLGWVHHDDAAAATVAALERGQPGTAYNVVDDEPATWADVFTAMAAALAAPRPRRVPRALLRIVAPFIATSVVDTSMRVSNAKARRELKWTPRFPTYREGVEFMARQVRVDTANSA